MSFSGHAKLAGVIGYPIEHSKSPVIHNYWLNKYGIDGVYVPLKVLPGNLTDVIKALPKMNFSGVNVTVPHKIETMKIADSLSLEAQKAGAVNTIIIKQDGSIHGHNTDGFGFLENLKEKKPDIDFTHLNPVVLGTGGASRGICAALVMAGCPEIRLVYRTKEKAEKIMEKTGGKYVLIPWDKKEEALEGAGILANATTLGMTGFEKLEIDLSTLPHQAVVTDLVYSPLKTELLLQAERHGYLTADGLGMLIHQARPAFQSWFGIMPQATDELRHLIAG